MKAKPKKPSRSNKWNKPNFALQDVLARWRGIDLTEQEKAQVPSTKSISALIPTVLSELGLDRRRAEAEIVRVWNNLLDPNIVAHAQPTGIYKGTLFVTVDNSVWLTELVRYRRKEILHRLQSSFGRDLITRISFRVA